MDGPNWLRVAVTPEPRPYEPKPYVADPEKIARRRQNATDRRKEKFAEAKAGRGLAHGQHPVTSEIDYKDDELEFLKAVDEYKRIKRRPFPTCREILWIALALGYRKVADPTPVAVGVKDDDAKQSGACVEQGVGADPAGLP